MFIIQTVRSKSYGAWGLFEAESKSKCPENREKRGVSWLILYNGTKGWVNLVGLSCSHWVVRPGKVAVIQ